MTETFDGRSISSLVKKKRSLAIFVRSPDGAFHWTTFASPPAWHSFPLISRVLSTDDLAWMSSIFSFISPRPQIYFWRFFFQQSKLSEPCPTIRQVSRSINVPVIINALLLFNIQIRMSSSGYVNVLQRE